VAPQHRDVISESVGFLEHPAIHRDPIRFDEHDDVGLVIVLVDRLSKGVKGPLS
jgi:hypothetical protein